MRVRTGHKPSDWTDNDPGGHARVSGHTGAYGGSFVQGESELDRRRRIERASRERNRTVDMSDYHREHRWDGKPRCGAMMRQAGQPCARMAGHTREHKTAEALEYSRLCRQKVPA